MLSILIPVYNTPVTKLVFELHKQAVEERILFEIIIIDDCSLKEYQSINNELLKLPNVKYIILKKNIGRSKIRNRLVAEATYNWLLFMDCDATVDNPSYIKNYTEHLDPESVLCGGTAYGPEPLIKDYYLRWYYGIKREQKPATERNRIPNCSFATFNFLMHKKVFEQIRFEESLSRYGHEDTLFGYKLEKLGYPVKHIDNPLIHNGLDRNKDFVVKTKQGIRNLYLISIDEHYKDYNFSNFTILRVYKLLQKVHCATFIGFLYKLFHKSLEKNLTSKNPKLLYLDLLKIGYLCTH